MQSTSVDVEVLVTAAQLCSGYKAAGYIVEASEGQVSLKCEVEDYSTTQADLTNLL